jgi:hypothetical protein
MESVARLIVTRGPDLGRAFDVSSDLAHIGCGGNNQIVLTDPSVATHQASIVRRSGRYALFTPLEQAVHVDGAEVPADRWVWLPAAALIDLGGDTSVQFEVTSLGTHGNGVATELPQVPAAAESAIPPAAKKDGSSSTVRRRKRKGEPRRTAAKLSTDPQGEPRVQLGADGRLPELNLTESVAPAADPSSKQGARPWLVITAVVASSAMSLLLMLWTPQSSGSASRENARENVKLFFGKDGEELEPYQRLLRQAIVEHSQGRLGEERRMYLRVLDLLNSASVRDPRNYYGLTGHQTGRGRNSDRELREFLEQLIATPE